MLTIRVDRQSDGSHECYEASRYRVLPGPAMAVVFLSGAGAEETVPLRAGDKAFVMNAAGNTVDRVVGA